MSLNFGWEFFATRYINYMKKYLIYIVALLALVIGFGAGIVYSKTNDVFTETIMPSPTPVIDAAVTPIENHAIIENKGTKPVSPSISSTTSTNPKPMPEKETTNPKTTVPFFSGFFAGTVNTNTDTTNSSERERLNEINNSLSELENSASQLSNNFNSAQKIAQNTRPGASSISGRVVLYAKNGWSLEKITRFFHIELMRPDEIEAITNLYNAAVALNEGNNKLTELMKEKATLNLKLQTN